MRVVFFLGVALLLASCGKDRIYESKINLPEGVWTYADSLEYNFSIQDTAQLYGLGITVEFTEDYPYENIYTDIKTFLPDKELRQAIFSIELQNRKKRRSLKCKDDHCVVDVFLQAPLKFVQKGDYTLRIFQHSRDEVLPGVKKVGVYVEKLKSVYKD